MAHENFDLAVTGRNLIKKWESLHLDAYLCPAGIPTIGWGHTDDVALGQRITTAQAEAFLTEDVQWAERVVERRVTAHINQSQFDALVSFIFNVGEGNFARSSVLRKVNAGDFAGAADSLLLWNKARDPATGQLRVLNGLVNRRVDERALFLSEPVVITRADVTDQGTIAMPEASPPVAGGRLGQAIGTGTAAVTGLGTVGTFIGSLPPIAQAGLMILVLALGFVAIRFVVIPMVKDWQSSKKVRLTPPAMKP